MKRNVKIISKILLVFVFLTLLPVSLSSCEYTGKQIVSIEKTNVEYMGGATSGQRLDLLTGEVYEFEYYPYDEKASYDYRLRYSYDASLSKEVVDAFYRVGLLSLRSKYEPLTIVMDGGGWELTITYADGTTKVSRGSNAGPYSTFRKAATEFYEITGGIFIQSPPSKYLGAPSLRVEYTMEIKKDNGTTYIYSYGGGMNPYTSTWRGKETEADPECIKAYHLDKSDRNYVYVDSSASHTVFKSARVFAYDGYFENEQEIPIEIRNSWSFTEGINKKFTFDIEEDKTYVIILEFDEGRAEYVFTTWIEP